MSDSHVALQIRCDERKAVSTLEVGVAPVGRVLTCHTQSYVPHFQILSCDFLSHHGNLSPALI